MSARDDLRVWADQMLRDADPLASTDLSRAYADESARSDLRRIVSTPREQRDRRWSPSRLVQLSVSAAGTAALVAVLGALLLHVRGGDEQPPAGPPVAPPPETYRLLDRPNRSGDALALPSYLWVEPVVPDSIRLALSSGGDRWFLARTPGGRVVCLLYTANGGGYSCGAGAASGSVAGGEAIGNRLVLSGAVPDGVTEVVVDGRTIPVESNIYHLDLDPKATHVSLDFRTEAGTIASWHEEFPIVSDRSPVTPVHGFDAAARALMTRPPYVGVACPTADSFACDRIGISVQLRKPAREVSAQVGSHTVVLNDPAWSGPATNGVRRRFAGFIQPAGLVDGQLRIPVARRTRWSGRPAVTVRIVVVATYADQSFGQITMRVRLHPGWG